MHYSSNKFCLYIKLLANLSKYIAVYRLLSFEHHHMMAVLNNLEDWVEARNLSDLKISENGKEID